MNKKTIKYQHKSYEVWLDPNSLAYQLYKENKLGELDKHLDILMRKNK